MAQYWGKPCLTLIKNFNIDKNYLDKGIKNTFCKLADNIKFDSSAYLFEGKKVLHRYLDRLDQWAESNHTIFNKTKKCQALRLGYKNSMQQHSLVEEWLESHPAERALWGC